MTFYEDLLKDLHEIETKVDNLTPSLRDKIRTLKFEVQHVIPKVGSRNVIEEPYEVLKGRFRVEESPEGLDEFVVYMLDRLKSTDYVLEKLKYAQSEEANHRMTLKVHIKTIEEKLLSMRSFCKLVTKWSFGGSNGANAKVLYICEVTGSLFGEAEEVSELFMLEKVDDSEVEVLDRQLSDMILKIDNSILQAKEFYFEIVKVFVRSPVGACPLQCQTICCFIDHLQNIMKEMSTYIQPFASNKGCRVQEIVSEMEFLRTILIHPWKVSMLPGELNAIATHIDVLIHEVLPVAYSSAKKLSNLTRNKVKKNKKKKKKQNLLKELGSHEAWIKVLDLINKIELTRREIRETNRQDMKLLHHLIEDFVFSIPPSPDIQLELFFLLTFSKCTIRWTVNHPRLGDIRSHVEKVVRKARWDFRCFQFRIFRNEEAIKEEEYECLLLHLLEKLKVKRPDIKEVCTAVRLLKPSSINCHISKDSGLDFADAVSDILKNLVARKFKSSSDTNHHNSNEIWFLGCLRMLTAEFCVQDKRRIDILTHLEDLTERAACLSFLVLIGKADQALSLNEILMRKRNLEFQQVFLTFIRAPIGYLSIIKGQADDLMMLLIHFMIRYLTDLKECQASILCCIEGVAETLQEELTVLKCILEDLPKQYAEQKELDDLLKDIAEGVIGAGLFILSFFCINRLKSDFYFLSPEKVEHFQAMVKQAYCKFVKLPPLEPVKPELGFFDNLLVKLTELKNHEADSVPVPTGQIGALRHDLLFCTSFLQENELKHNEQEELKHLRRQVISVSYKVENVIDTFWEVPHWLLREGFNDITHEVKLIKEELANSIKNLKATSNSGCSDKKVGVIVNKNKVASVQLKDEDKGARTVMLDFETAERTLMKKLTSASQRLEVLSIVGMPGSGKTTLAMKVYENVSGSFPAHGWCYVSQHYQKKELLEDIINQIDGPIREIQELSEQDLAQMLYQILLKKKDYLIIFDDIWDVNVWNEMKACFPSTKGRNKVLLTSRLKSINLKADEDSTCIELELLSIEKSWNLLEEKVFGTGGSPPELRAVGKRIAGKCEGLPLSVVVIAGVLKNVQRTLVKWMEVEKSLDCLLVESQNSILSKLELSYMHLSTSMKQCFLYCGAYLKSNEISRFKMVQMWVAERFIEVSDLQQRLEAAAEYCLNDLVDRSLLIIAKIGSDNRVRICRIHDLLRDFLHTKST